MKKLILANLSIVFLLGMVVLPKTTLAGEIEVVLENGENITISHLLVKGETKAFVENIEEQYLGNGTSLRIAVPTSRKLGAGNSYIFIPSNLLTAINTDRFMSLAKNPNSKLVCSKAIINNTDRGFINDEITADVICGSISLK